MSKEVLYRFTVVTLIYMPRENKNGGTFSQPSGSPKTIVYLEVGENSHQVDVFFPASITH